MVLLANLTYLFFLLFLSWFAISLSRRKAELDHRKKFSMQGFESQDEAFDLFYLFCWHIRKMERKGRFYVWNLHNFWFMSIQCCLKGAFQALGFRSKSLFRFRGSNVQSLKPNSKALCFRSTWNSRYYLSKKCWFFYLFIRFLLWFTHIQYNWFPK